MSIGMSDELKSFDQRAVIKVCGVGGGGGNAVKRMIEQGMEDVEFIAVNTDAQALKESPAAVRLQIGTDITSGLGSGADPTIGHQAAQEDRERLADVLGGADMVFVTTGLGGGTGTGAAPIVAEVARSSGALTVGIATLPFAFEGNERMDNAMTGLAEMEAHVDTLVVIPNERVARICQENISFLEAFKHADEVLHNGVRAISELITIPGLINLDFADVRTIMKARGRALMGIGVATGENRAVRAAEEAIVCPLLEQSNIHGAKGVVANIKGGCDIGMREVQEAVATVKDAAHPDANIIFGAVVDDEERPDLQVTVIAAGFETGVSDSFLNEENIVQLKPIEVNSPQSESKGVPNTDAAASADPEQVATAAREEAEYLFPQEEAASGASEPQEPEEDISVPAFMRKKRRIQ